MKPKYRCQYCHTPCCSPELLCGNCGAKRRLIRKIKRMLGGARRVAARPEGAR